MNPNSTMTGFVTNGLRFSNNLAVVDVSATSDWASYGPAYSGNYSVVNDYFGDFVITKEHGGTFNFGGTAVKSWDSVPPALAAGTLKAYAGGALLGSISFVNSNQWQFLNANFIGADKVVISAGTALIDNFTINPVPEPETYAMLLAGLGLMGAVARRRNKR
ncbi:PEP-CTERM sorting domain-containing protein [Chitinimonas arctica]|uniref:PEP-CTERM sorting domain-containing protein n=1 Tax=Chitinimonas arctica TaxID=2594795 RepID=UPI0015D3158D|nr:PEP-CTERM sorting domain-containing protein [Chitinimonas arctica]